MHPARPPLHAHETGEKPLKLAVSSVRRLSNAVGVTEGRRLRTSGWKELPERSDHSALFGARAGFQRDHELRIRGGGNRKTNMALTPTERMGQPPGASPPMRMPASWSGS